jgi:hypothetical protein
MGNTIPPVLQMMRDIGGVEMPAFFGKLVTEQTTGSSAGKAAETDKGHGATPSASSKS